MGIFKSKPRAPLTPEEAARIKKRNENILSFGSSMLNFMQPSQLFKKKQPQVRVDYSLQKDKLPDAPAKLTYSTEGYTNTISQIQKQANVKVDSPDVITGALQKMYQNANAMQSISKAGAELDAAKTDTERANIEADYKHGIAKTAAINKNIATGNRLIENKAGNEAAWRQTSQEEEIKRKMQNINAPLKMLEAFVKKGVAKERKESREYHDKYLRDFEYFYDALDFEAEGFDLQAAIKEFNLSRGYSEDDTPGAHEAALGQL